MLDVDMKATGPVSEGKAPHIIDQEIRGAMDLAGQVIETAVKEHTPVGISGGTTSGLLGSIAASGVTKYGVNGYQNRIAPGVPYGIVVEQGRAYPGPMPPIEPIQLWVKRKGRRVLPAEAFAPKTEDETDEEIERRLAFLIARKIAARGFMEKEGYKMFERGLDEVENQVIAILGPQMKVRITRRMERK